MSDALAGRPPAVGELSGEAITNSLSPGEWQSRLAPPESSVLPSFRPGGLPPMSGTRKRALPQRPQVSGRIEVTATGARAEFGPHKVQFKANSVDAEPVQLTSPDGTLLRSRILGLCYLDLDSGESVLIAEPKYSVGQITGDNRILFPDALDAVSVDVLYTYTRHSLEQDLIIRKQLPAPGELGLRGTNIHLAVMTEFINPPAPQRRSKPISVAEPLAAPGAAPILLADEEIGLASMRIVRGKAFSLGTDPEPIPVVKRWEVLEGRQFLVESTPLKWIAPKLAALPRYAGGTLERTPGNLKQLLASTGREMRTTAALASIEPTTRRPEDQPGVVLDYLIVNQALLNVNFADYNKAGFAALGQESWDWWNVYDFPGNTAAALPDLQWSDYTGNSGVGIVVSNAPAVGNFSLIEDSMYGNFVYGSNSARLTVTITNLPANVYDLLVYAPRTPANGSPVVELKLAGTTLWTKNLTQWGSGWHSPAWDEGEQYVRFRDIAVTNQSLRLEVIPDAAGYATLSGLQMVPAGAVPSDLPTINKLINVDVAIAHSNKVGFAAVGLTSSDVWNNYSYPYATAASLANLKRSDNTTSPAGLVLRNGPGQWGNLLPDVMYRNYVYAQNQGNITVTLTNLPSGNYDFFLYGHTTTLDDNAVVEVWSDEVNWGLKGTSLQGYGPTSNRWELGQQYVRLAGVAVVSNRPVYLQAKKTKYGYNNLSGFQLARTGDLDTDADGLPDAWEMKWFATLDYDAVTDYDYDGLTNLREYQLGLIPTRSDSDGDGVADWQDNEFPWFDDSAPPGALLYGTWSWVSSWSDGTGWGGGTVYPHSGSKLRVTSLVSGAAHQHYFERALGVTRARTGDVFYAYVNLDSTYPPTEVMLQFYVLGDNGAFSWERRAYWGANSINWGTDGTLSRTNLGALPATGQWVRLEVPASKVGLEGKIVEGMAFALYGGRAAWDSAGIVVPDMDGDGVADMDADGLPDPWEWAHFGGLGEPADGDYDNDGDSNLLEYQNGTDPNTIQFSLTATNNYVNSSSTAVGIEVEAGVATSMAVLVDSTNFAGATWTTYNSVATLNLGSSERWHEVWIGLRGRQTDSQQTWGWKRFNRDATPPQLVVTNPVSSTVSQPMIQLQGYSPEPVRGLHYDITNAAGLLTNQQVLLLDQHYDTNTWAFTVNVFQAFDVDLTNGLNTITLYATDLAGNTTATNLDFTLDYSSKTNPPLIQLNWPLNGMEVCGSEFTCDGWVDDFTATMTASISGPNGSTNVVSGLIERDGRFWVEDLPLSEGTNYLTLTVTDAVGNVASTNISVFKDAFVLTMDEVSPPEKLWQRLVDLTGTISDPAYAVWANGVKGVNHGNGTWSVNNVPVPTGGTPSFRIQGYSPDEQQPDGSYGN